MTDRLALLVQPLISGRPAEDRRVRQGRKLAVPVPEVKRAAGVSEGVICKLQGWKTAAMFRRYSVVDNRNRLAALQLVENPHNPGTVTQRRVDA